ncbi:prepilin-type N-terminal cleavage/methylation domain-containing protein [Cloacibacillus evryensis]|uniref:prepilin-type N-terminal cleavage/methylation domain-containing protein n=1 Tax=Cloacibacillus evryensis TaxID=508460 RepID=UPI002585D116|nr:prepilin-type N-terminal cleavage/methylation domain-containing protein [Cloacibacillus evryensis]
MDKLLKNKKNRAFTLVEILIVVIIIGILAGLMALSAGSSTETAEKTACRGDRRTIKSAYYVERAENGKTFKESLEKAMEQFTKVKNLSTADDSAFCLGVCHAGGTYSMTTTSNDRLLISCSIEGHDEEKMDRTKTIYEHVLAAYKEMASGVEWPSGRKLMELVGKLLGGPYVYDGKEYYVKADIKGKSGDPLLYASENKFGGANSYVAEYVYNSETDRWYKCSPSINTAAMNGDIKNQVYGSIKNGSEIIYGSELVNVTWTEVPGFSPFLK